MSFAGALSSNISLPDTPTTRVSRQLERDFEGTGGGNGSIVAETTDGSALTTAQQDELVALFDRIAEVDSVADVSDPFATQDQLDSSAEQVADGREQLNDGLAQLSEAQAQIDAGRAAVAQQRAQAREDGTLAAIRAQLDAAEQQLDDGQAELDRQQARVDEQAPQLEQGATLTALSAGFRTVSEDGSAAVANVTFDVSTNEVTAEVKTEIEDLVADAGIDGVDVYPSQDIAQTVPSILGPGEIAGVVVAAIVLFVMLGTVIGAALPLLTALLGVGVASLASLSFSGIVDFVSVTPVLGVMLGLAVGIDYSLFIINRHRRQLLQGADLHESIGLANGTSGNAVVFAGVTVIVALLALNVTGVGFLGLMGTVGAVAVLVAILMAITLTPAVLALVGPRILRRKERARRPRHDVRRRRGHHRARQADEHHPRLDRARTRRGCPARRGRARDADAPRAPRRFDAAAGLRRLQGVRHPGGEVRRRVQRPAAGRRRPARGRQRGRGPRRAGCGRRAAGPGLERRGSRADRRVAGPQRTGVPGRPRRFTVERVDRGARPEPPLRSPRRRPQEARQHSVSPATPAPASTSPTSSPKCCRSTSCSWSGSRC